MNDIVARALLSVWLIALVAFGLRMGFAADQARKVPAEVLREVPFEQETGNIAAAVAEGRGFSDVFRGGTGKTAWLAPVYPALLAGIFKVFGVFTVSSLLAAVTLNAVCSAAVCFPLCWIGNRVGGPMLGAAAGWLWAIYPNGIVMPFEWIWDTSLSALLAVSLIWATMAIAERTQRSNEVLAWCGYGAFWGLALLTNPALGAMLPFLLAWAAIRTAGASGRGWRMAAAVLAMLAVCTPWTIRNYRVFGRVAPVRSSFPFELWIGNNDIFDPNGVRVRITRFEEARRYAQLGENAYLDEKWSEATEFFRRHPALEVRLTARRALAFWFGTPDPLASFGKAETLLEWMLVVTGFLLAAGTLLGVFRLAQLGNAFVIPLVTAPAAYPIVFYATHASLRYQHPIDPILLLLTAYGIGSLLRARRGTAQRAG